MRTYEQHLEDAAAEALIEPDRLYEIIDCDPKEFCRRLAMCCYRADHHDEGDWKAKAAWSLDDFEKYMIDVAKSMHNIQQQATDAYNTEAFYEEAA